MITSVVLAAKFYLETCDLVVNSDIARLLSTSGTVMDLNGMEEALTDLLDFDLWVSSEQYNQKANSINVLIQKARVVDLERIKEEKLQRKAQRNATRHMRKWASVPKSQSLTQLDCAHHEHSPSSLYSVLSDFSLSSLFSIIP